jgi:hypothetical protein
MWSGNEGRLQRIWERLTPCLALGTQMVVVNSSSPTAACSGPWEARGMEESVPTTDGSAESLYVQGRGWPWVSGVGGWEEWPSGSPGRAQVTSPGPAPPSPRLPM